MTSIVDYQSTSTVQVPGEMFPYQTDIVLQDNYPISHGNISPGTCTRAQKGPTRATTTHFKRLTAQKESYSQGSNRARATNITMYIHFAPSEKTHPSTQTHETESVSTSASPAFPFSSPRLIGRSSTNLRLGVFRLAMVGSALSSGAVPYGHRCRRNPSFPAPEGEHSDRVVFPFFLQE